MWILLSLFYFLSFLFLSFIMSVNIAMGLKCQLIEDSMKDSMSASILMSHMVIFCGSILNWVMMSPLKDPFLSYDMKSVPTFLILSGLILMNLWSLTENSFKNFFSFLFLNMSFFMWFLVPMSSQMTMNFSLHLSKMSLKVDQGWLETLGPTGIYYYLSTSMIYKHSFMSSML